MSETPEPPVQFQLQPKELIELILKSQDIHEGRWVLAAEFGIGTGNFGPSADQLVPGVAIGLSKVGIQQVTGNQTVPAQIIVDAALVNPLSSRRGPKRTAKTSKKKKVKSSSLR
jgi:hypothetical protein